MADIRFKPKREVSPEQAAQDVMMVTPVGIARAASRVPSLAHKVGAHVIKKIRAGRRRAARLLARRPKREERARRMSLRGRR